MQVATFAAVGPHPPPTLTPHTPPTHGMQAVQCCLCSAHLASAHRSPHILFPVPVPLPPVALQGKEVEYSLRLLPLGGYVAFPDDDPESPYPGERQAASGY